MMDVDAIISALSAKEAIERERAADEVTDIHHALGDAKILKITQALVQARISEAVDACQEAQLNALAELSVWHALDAQLLRLLLTKELQGVEGAQVEHLQVLKDD